MYSSHSVYPQGTDSDYRKDLTPVIKSIKQIQHMKKSIKHSVNTSVHN